MAAGSPPPIVELDEEIEGDCDSAGDILFSRVGEPVPLLPGDPPFYGPGSYPLRPIVVSEPKRLLFLAYPEGFFVARTEEAIRLAKLIGDKGKGPCIRDICIADVKIGRVSLLQLSGDSSMLAAVVGGGAHIFSVDSLAKKELLPISSCSVHDSGIIKDFKWKKNPVKTFIILTSHGSLYHGYLDSQLKEVMDNVDAVDLCTNGNFIILARNNILSIMTPDQIEILHMSLLVESLSSDVNSTFSMKVDTIRWIKDDSIVIGHVRVSEDGKEDGYVVQVVSKERDGFTKSSIKPVVFSFPDLFVDVSEDVLPNGSGPNLLLVNYLERWEVALTSFRKSVGSHLTLIRWLLNEETREAASLEFENELYTPRIDLQENGDDNLLLGFDVDKISFKDKLSIKVEVDYKEVVPYCLLLCITSEGKLLVYHIARISDPLDLHSSGIQSLDAKGAIEITEGTTPVRDFISATLEFHDEDKGTEMKDVGSLEASNVRRGENFAIENVQRTTGSHTHPSMKAVAVNEVAPPSHISGTTVSQTNNGRSIFKGHGIVFALDKMNNISTGNTSGEASVTKQMCPKISDSGILIPSTSAGLSAGLVLENKNNELRDRSSLSPRENSSSSILPENKFISQVSSLFKPFDFPSNNSGKSSWTTKDASPPAFQLQGSLFSQHGTSPVKSSDSMVPPSMSIFANRKCASSLDSKPGLYQQFYNGNDMAKDLDILLSFIETNCGFRDSCSPFESSILVLEKNLEDLSETTQTRLHNVERQLLEVHKLQNTRQLVLEMQVFMEGILKHASNSLYWEMQNQRRLCPELELKQQSILSKSQSLMNQLIELERHFHTIEVCKFGEINKVQAGSRGSHDKLKRSRYLQSMQIMVNTANSQLSAAEQLSVSLSKQMAALNINYPQTKHPDVYKELFESIGLPLEYGKLQSPSGKGLDRTPDSIKKILSTPAINSKNMKSTPSVSKALEPGTLRRRGSLDRQSLMRFEPQKTTVKRMHREEQDVAFVDKMHRVNPRSVAGQFETAKKFSPSSSQPSINKFVPQDLPAMIGIQGEPPKGAFESQFLESKFMASTSSLSSEIKNMTCMTSGLTDSSRTNMFNVADLSESSISKSCPVSETQYVELGTLPHSKTSSKFTNFVSTTQSMLASKTVNGKRSTGGQSNPRIQEHGLQRSSATSMASSPEGASLSSRNTGTLPLSPDSSVSSPDTRTQQSYSSTRKNQSPPVVSSVASLSAVSSSLQPKSLSAPVMPPLDSSSVPSASSPLSSASSLGLSSPEAKHSSTFKVASTVSASISPLLSSLSISASTESMSNVKFSEMTNSASLSSTSVPISLPFSSSTPFSVQFQKLPTVLSETSSSTSSAENTNSGPMYASAILQNSVSLTTCKPSDVNSKSETVSSPALNEVLDGSPLIEKPSVIFAPIDKGLAALSSSSSKLVSAKASLPNIAITENNEAANPTSIQEDEMEEEVSEVNNTFDMDALGSFGFGLGSGPSGLPKPNSNPFGGSFNTPMISSSPPLMTSPDAGFRPASFSLPPSSLQLSPPANPGPFSGFGQPAQIGSVQPTQIGAGQQALGSVLGAFGQSRKLGAGMPGVGFAATSGFGGSGFSPSGSTVNGSGMGFSAMAPSSGGFSGVAVGGFTTIASGTGGFAGAAAGGGFAAAAASVGGGFATTPSGGGFAGMGSKIGGFAGLPSSGGGFGGGGFGAFSGSQGSAFSAFGSNNNAAGVAANRPPSELLTQMRK